MSIDIEVFTRAMKKYKGFTNSLQKYVHGWWPVAERVKHYGSKKITKCPWCNGRERQDHVLRCPHPEASAIRDMAWQALWNQIEEKTDPTLLSTMKRCVHSWHQNPLFQASRVLDHHLNEGLKQQNWIGWTHFLMGRISKGLIAYQAKHYPNSSPEEAL